MTETDDRLWKKPQNVRDFAEPKEVKISKPNEEIASGIWTEFSNHPSWNNLFVILENYINRCAELEKKANDKHYDCETKLKKVSIRKKYKKYKKRYRLIKNETSRASDSGYECTPQNEKPTTIKSGEYNK